MGTISRNFSYREFERSATADAHMICNVIRTFEVRDAIYELVEEVLQPLRDEIGEPIDISSGYRCPELNAFIPRSSPTSQHTKGEAADIKARSLFPLDLARVIVRMGLPFDQLILYPTFVHVSHKMGGPQRGQILYNRSYKGDRI
jgi:uncharacterized protein YcbK (DUF882 family)